MFLQLLVCKQHLDAVLHIIKGGWRTVADIIQKDDMPAKLCLHRCLGVGTFLKRSCGVGKRLHHLARTKPAQFAATGAGRAGGLFLGKFREVAAAVKQLDNLFRRVLVFHENMTCVIFLARLAYLLIVDGLYCFIRDGIIGHEVLDGGTGKRGARLLVECGNDNRLRVHTLADSFLPHQLKRDQLVQYRFLCVRLLIAGPRLALGGIDVQDVLGDRAVVDGGNDDAFDNRCSRGCSVLAAHAAA